MSRRPFDPSSQADILEFAAETDADASAADAPAAWKILVVDDEQDVHNVTRMVLHHFAFAGRGVQLLNAFSAAEARRMLTETDDIAVILLDVVMEADDAGLRLVRHIRRELGNRNVRIILRTGQPGQAPEQRVVAEYDINDYKCKVELTADKLCTAVTSALRAWRDLCELERSRGGLRHILDTHGTLLGTELRTDFADRVLDGMMNLLNETGRRPSGTRAAGGLVARRRGGHYVCTASRGRLAVRSGATIDEISEPQVRSLVSQAQVTGDPAFDADTFCAICRADGDGGELLLLLTAAGRLHRSERDLLRVYAANTTLAFRNRSLTSEIIEGQKEMILTLGEVVETRSRETAHHVRRVGEMAALLAQRAGADAETTRILRAAAPLHDVGKVGIPDAILHKPGNLTPREFELMKTHTVIGHAILSKSERRVLRTAAEIALQHHERWDGGGYPLGRRGRATSFAGRVTAVVDVFDALASPRVYRRALPPAQVLEYLRGGRAQQFDPDLVDVLLDHADEFIALLRAYPDGSRSAPAAPAASAAPVAVRSTAPADADLARCQNAV